MKRYKNKYKQITCPVCNGNKEVSLPGDFDDATGIVYLKYVKCQMCNGTGKYRECIDDFEVTTIYDNIEKALIRSRLNLRVLRYTKFNRAIKNIVLPKKKGLLK